MSSTYSTNLHIELMGTGDQSGTWGTTTNNNFVNIFEGAIADQASVVFPTDADYTLTYTNNSTTLQAASCAYLAITSTPSLTATRSLIVPTINKPYYVSNSTSGSQSIIVKTVSGTGITIPNGATTMLYVNGTNVIAAFSYSNSLTLGSALPTGSGGTGLSTFTSGGAVYASSSSALTTGTLPVTAGGLGVATITGMMKGNGISAVTAGTAGTDYVAPTVATTFTATQTFNGTSSTAAMKETNIIEPASITGTAPTATTNFYVNTGAVQYITANNANNWTLNFAFSSGTTLNSAMTTNDSLSCTLITTNTTTAYYLSAITVDGTGSGVTVKWQGGSAPTSGNASSIDSYTFVIIKTGSAAYTVLASQTKFA
jgi:hypothetical protein